MTHAITPTASGRRAPLTRTSDVLLVLRNGGTVRTGSRDGLLELVDRDGREVDAWQTAIKNAQRRVAA